MKSRDRLLPSARSPGSCERFMPRKISVKSAADRFQDASETIMEFFEETKGLKDSHHSNCTEYSIIWLYREFETLMLSSLSGAINNDAETISSTIGISFPKHLSQPVCEYLIIGTGYFDFRGRDGLLKTIKKYIPADHILVSILKKAEYRQSLEILSALRNFAAHNSSKAKESARAAIGGEKIGSAGSWLKKQDRFDELVDDLRKIGKEIHGAFPY